LNSGVSKGVPKIADLTSLSDVHIQERTAASQRKGYLRSPVLMGLQEPLQRKIGHHVAVVTENGFVLVQEILNVFQPPCRVQKGRFIAKGDGDTPPLPIRKFLRVTLRTVMGVHDEAIHADVQEVIHGVSDDRASLDLEKWLRDTLC